MSCIIKIAKNTVIISLAIFFIFLLLPNRALAAEGDLIWAQSNDYNPSFNDEAKDVTADSTGIYAVGYDYSDGSRWRIEKMTLTDGNSIWTRTNSPSGGLDSANSVAVDSTGIYVVGVENAALLDPQWRIEKRSLIGGNLIWVKTVNPSISSDMAYDVTVDSTGVYIAGDMDGFKIWRIEKRSLTDGNLIWEKTNDTTLNVDRAFGVAVDGTGVYTVGYGYDYPSSFTGAQWRIEKRSLANGNLIWEKTNNPTAENDVAYAVAVDSTGVYIVGYDSSDLRWRIEKRSLIDGSLIWEKTNNHSVDTDIPYRVTVDNTGLYVVGFDSSTGPNDPQWRIEKRSLADGNLIWQRTNNPGTPDIADFAEGVSIGSSGIYIGGSGDGGWRIEKRCLNNCPPTASFNVTPTSGTISTVFNVDASGSSDPEDALANLQVRWDWENDGTFDTGWSTTKTNSHTYSTAGVKTIKMEVKDTGGLTGDTVRTVTVINPSPPTANDQSVTTNQNTAADIVLNGIKNGDGVVDITHTSLNYHSLAVKSDGTVWGWGLNSWGQAGDCFSANVCPIPHKINGEFGFNNIIKVAAGFESSIALKSDGTVWVWGRNGAVSSDPIAQKIIGLSNIVDITAGGDSGFLYALAQNGSIYEYRYRTNSLSLLPNLPGVVSILGSETTAGKVLFVVKSDGTVWRRVVIGAWEQIPNLNNVVSIANGFNYGYGADDMGYLFALKENGTVEYSQKGITTPIAGLINTVAINGYDSPSRVSAGYLESNGDVWEWKKDVGMSETLSKIVGTDNIINVGGGGNYYLTLKSNGAVWALGLNNEGQLGDYTIIDKSTPVQTEFTLNYTITTLPTNGSIRDMATGLIISVVPYSFGMNPFLSAPYSPYSSGIYPDVIYTPNLNYTGPDSFQFKVNNGIQDSAAGTVNITVNQIAYTLSVNSSGAAGVAITSVTGDGGTTNYTKTGLASGSSRTLTAPATSGAFTFSSWTGCSSVAGVTCNRTMDANRTVMANYIASPPNLPSNLTAPNWSYAQASQFGALKAFLKWQFSDPNPGASESAYQIIMDDDPNPASPLVDTGKCLGYQNPLAGCLIDAGVDSFPPTNGQLNLSYNTKYYWWVKVWNNYDLASGFKQYDTVPDTDNDDGDPLTFTTYKHEFPLVDFSWTPAEPSQGEKVKFTDASKYYTGALPSSPTNCNPGQCSYLWTVPADATIDNGSAKNPQIIFGSSGQMSVTLKVTDDDGYYSSLTKNLNLKPSLPSWREVKP